MSALSDGQLRLALEQGRLVIQPMPTWAVPDGKPGIQPASIDLHLADTIRVFTEKYDVIELGDSQPDMTEVVVIPPTGWLLPPSGFVLGSTCETFVVPPDLVGLVNARSSTGRDGLIMEIAGFVDPGFAGTLTFEMHNLFQRKYIRLRAGRSVAQISFWQLTEPALRPYGHPELKSRYQGQQGPTPAYHKLLELVPATDDLLRPDQVVLLEEPGGTI